MVEVSRDNDEVFALLLGAGFLAFDKLGNEIKTASRGGNIFCTARHVWQLYMKSILRR